MGLRFNLRTLFLVTALVAGAFYIGWRISKYHPTGHIDDGDYATQVEQEENGLFFTFTASTKPVKQLTFTIYEPSGRDILFYAKQQFTPCQRKQVRILVNNACLPPVESNGDVLVIRLPTKLQGCKYELKLPNNSQYELLAQTSYGFGIHQIIDEHDRKYELVDTINDDNVEFVPGEPLSWNAADVLSNP